MIDTSLHSMVFALRAKKKKYGVVELDLDELVRERHPDRYCGLPVPRQRPGDMMPKTSMSSSNAILCSSKGRRGSQPSSHPMPDE
jgi:hypothetical protein